MPPALHRRLRRGLDFDGSTINPEDLIEEFVPQESHPDERAAKRRRIEAVATQYLSRGKTPMILSAALKGPFNDGWNNPWATEAKQKKKILDKSNTASEQENATSLHGRTRTRNATRSKSGRNLGGQRTRISAQAPSPEASRATRHDMNLSQQYHNAEVVEVPPATAPSPGEDEASGITLSYSAETARSVQERSQLTNPFWIRRSGSQRLENPHRNYGANIDSSPIRTCSKNGRMRECSRRTLKVAPPTYPLPPRRSPNEAPHQTWMSSATASMVIPTPIQDVTQEKDVSTGIIPGESVISRLPAETAMDSGPYPPSATLRSSTRKGISSRPPSQNLLSKDRATARQLPQSETQNRSSSQSGTARSRIVSTSEVQADPETAVVDALDTERPRPKSRPRIIDFDSTQPLMSKSGSQQRIIEGSKDLVHARIAAPANSDTSILEGPCEAELDAPVALQGESRFLQLKHNSAMSTQAVMMLAQLDFQSSSCCPATSPDRRRPWSQTSINTPRASAPVLSPAVTPLSVFNDQLGKLVPQQSLPRRPPISTQDLFGAASPFAFSTIKKPELAHQQSNPISHMGTDGKKNITALTESPTPSADRVALKDKNVATSFWASILDKASQASQEPLVYRSIPTISDVELPQLDFGGSLHEYNSHGEVHFADRFLQDLANT